MCIRDRSLSAIQDSTTGNWLFAPVATSNTGLNEHNFLDMVWGQIVDSYDRGQRITLDSEITVSPKTMIISRDKSDSDRTINGPTLRSVERMKFNQTPQSIDNELYLQTIENMENNIDQRSNIGHETITYQYATAPTTIIELNRLNQI